MSVKSVDLMSTENDASEKSELAPDEVFCTSCGETIKEEAEVCPECGVAQNSGSDSEGLPESRKYELQKLARKDKTTTAIVGFLISPVGYIMVGKTGLAVINFFTLNYFLLGVIAVPIHVSKIIENARQELERHGETW